MRPDVAMPAAIIACAALLAVLVTGTLGALFHWPSIVLP